MNHCMIRPKLCIHAKTKMQLSFAVTDQIRGYREADQRLCFPYTNSTIPLLSKSEILSILAFSVFVHPVVPDLVGIPDCWFCHTKVHI